MPDAPRRHYSPGAHELGQNVLADPRVVRDVVHAVASRDLPLVEWAAGDGALTASLAELGRPLEAVEVDVRPLAALRRRVGPHVAVTEGDILRHAPPFPEFDVVSNVPFSITTPVLRRLLPLPGWGRAVLLVQWEVARKRAGVGGATQMTAQWWPWVDVRLVRRVPAAAFRPRPSVDGGVVVLDRRDPPLLDRGERAGYQRWVRDVFSGRGRGLPAVLARAGGARRGDVVRWCRSRGLRPEALPRDLRAADWVEAWRRWGSVR